MKNKAPKVKYKAPEEKFGISPSKEKSSHFGIILGILIVLLALVLAGLYAWSVYLQKEIPVVIEEPKVERPTDEENKEPESNNAKADVQAIQTVSTSDELSAIEADIESTNLLWTEIDIETFEAELNASLTQ